MEIEINENKNDDDLFKFYFDQKFNLVKEFYKEIDEFSLSSYFFFFKGIQSEFGINKKKNLYYSLEYYEQGGNLNNPFCFYRLYFLNVKDNFEKSLYYLLKFFAYYDHYSNLSNFITNQKFKDLKEILKCNKENIENFIKKNQSEFLISNKDLEFLLKNLNQIQKEDANDGIQLYSSSYYSSLFDIYKSSKHEEALYHIFYYLVKMNQNSYLEELLSEKTIRNSNIKLYPLLVDFIKQNINRINNNIFMNNIFHLIKENVNEFKRKLKIGGYFRLHAELIANSFYVKDLVECVEDKLKIKVDKVINKLYKSIQCGDFYAIPDFFHLNLFYCKHIGDYDNLHSSEMFSNVLQILDELDLEIIKFNPNLMLINTFYYMKGIKIKKDYKKSFQILDNILIKLKKENADNLNIIVEYYIIKCYQKLSDKESIQNCIDSFNQKIQILIKKNNNNCCCQLSIQSTYLISKFLLIHKNDVANSYELLSNCLQINYNYKFKPNSFANSNFNFSLSIIDKIFICKILNFISLRKEYMNINQINLNDFCNLSQFENTKNEINVCEFCNEREKEIMAVPCGHKFICSECIQIKEKFLLDEDIFCKKCNHKIESYLKKIYY